MMYLCRAWHVVNRFTGVVLASFIDASSAYDFLYDNFPDDGTFAVEYFDRVVEDR